MLFILEASVELLPHTTTGLGLHGCNFKKFVDLSRGNSIRVEGMSACQFFDVFTVFLSSVEMETVSFQNKHGLEGGRLSVYHNKSFILKGNVTSTRNKMTKCRKI